MKNANWKIYLDDNTILTNRALKSWLSKCEVVQGSIKEYRAKNNYSGQLVTLGSTVYKLDVTPQELQEQMLKARQSSGCWECEKKCPKCLKKCCK